MGIKVKLISKRRAYSESFKLELVSLFEKGKYSVLELEKLYGVKTTVIYRWIYRYSLVNKAGCRIVEMKQSSTSKVKALEQRIRELEAVVGQKQIRIDLLEEMIKVAGEELSIDIKKKSSTPPFGGSGKSGKR